MFRVLLAIAAVVIGVWVLVNALVTTDRERVEQTVERLIELARQGGPEAVNGILATIAEDYRGDEPFTVKRVRRELDEWVGKRRLSSLETGGITTVWKGEEIVVPLLTVYTEYGNFFLRVAFAERGGEWKVVDVSRWRRD